MPTDDQQLDADIQKLIERDRLLIKHRGSEAVEMLLEMCCHRCGKPGVVFVREKMIYRHLCRDGQEFEWTNLFEDAVRLMVLKVAVCAAGIKGMITGVREQSRAWVVIGVRQDNGGPWMSRRPKIIDEPPSNIALEAAVKAIR